MLFGVEDSVEGIDCKEPQVEVEDDVTLDG